MAEVRVFIPWHRSLLGCLGLVVSHAEELSSPQSIPLYTTLHDSLPGLSVPSFPRAGVMKALFSLAWAAPPSLVIHL